MRIVSCNPLELRDPGLPPPYSGLPLAAPGEWPAFSAEYRRVIEGMHAEFSEFCVKRGAPPLPEGSSSTNRPWLNLYLFPRELDYPRSRAPRAHLAQPRIERSRHRPALEPAARAR